MNLVFNHIKKIVVGLFRLLQGMYVTMKNMLRPKITEQYPENRGTHHYFERFRAQLVMPHNEHNEHKCTACEICMINCPNGTIRVISKMEVEEETGKEKKTLERYQYDIGSCIFCAICTTICPQSAIEWSNDFEHSIFTRSKLHQRLNREGSKLMTKKEK